MANWDFVYDIYNDTCDNFNPYKIKCFTPELYQHYFPLGESCESCTLDHFDPMPKCAGTSLCKLRSKDNSVCKDVILTRGFKEGLTIRTGNALWLLKHKIPFILRACVENNLELHHKTINAYDNRADQVALVDDHHSIHGELKMIVTTIKILEKELLDHPTRGIKSVIKKQKRLYNKRAESVTDSPRVFKIINIITQVIEGRKTSDDAQKELEDIEAVFPIGTKIIHDYRKIKGMHKEIIEHNIKKQQEANKCHTKHLISGCSMEVNQHQFRKQQKRLIF